MWLGSFERLVVLTKTRVPGRRLIVFRGLFLDLTGLVSNITQFRQPAAQRECHADTAGSQMTIPEYGEWIYGIASPASRACNEKHMI